MENTRILSENFQFLVVKFSIHLNRRVFIMDDTNATYEITDAQRTTKKKKKKKRTILERSVEKNTGGF